MLLPARRRQGRPGRVALRQIERRGVPGLVVEPGCDTLGKAPLPCPDILQRPAHQRIELRGEPRPVERCRFGFLHALDGAALDEEPLHRIERRQFVVARLQRADFGADPEQRPEEILDMRRQIDNQIGFGRMPEPVGVAPRRHQPGVQCLIRVGEFGDKGAIEPQKPLAIIEIGEFKPVFQVDFGHRSSKFSSGRAARSLRSDDRPAELRQFAATDLRGCRRAAASVGLEKPARDAGPDTADTRRKNRQQV